MAEIRAAEVRDASRIAEILVFSKRTNYRRIFRDDAVSFGVIQVYPLAKDYIDHPEKLDSIYVWDDEFVRGMVHIEDDCIAELYVDPFFTGQGIGSRLIEFACTEFGCRRLWVLEKNERAIAFYKRNGFAFTGTRRLQEGTAEFIAEMRRESR